MNSIINFNLQNHNVSAFVPIAATAPMLATYPHVYSQMWDARDASSINTGVSAANSTLTRPGSPFFTERIITPTQYMGATTIPVIHKIDENFAFFTYNTANANNGATDSAPATTNLFVAGDVEPKLNDVFHGLQTIRIPKNRFDTLLTAQADIDANNGVEYKPNLGKYYINISPKHIDAVIAIITPRIDNTDFYKQNVANGATYVGSEYATLSGSPANQRAISGSPANQRAIYAIEQTGFKNTAWNFEATYGQHGRLFGSIVEVWNSTLTVLKTTKIMGENIVNPLVTGNAACCLEYDAFGYEAPSQIPIVGDVLRIYPRETYFNPIIVEVDYTGSGNDVMSLIRFMKNDVARNLDTGVYEIYDDKGIGLDANKNISGTVIQSYQISREGKYEIRRGVGVSKPVISTTSTGGSTSGSTGGSTGGFSVDSSETVSTFGGQQ